jgi:hypothetical protein
MVSSDLSTASFSLLVVAANWALRQQTLGGNAQVAGVEAIACSTTSGQPRGGHYRQSSRSCPKPK